MIRFAGYKKYYNNNLIIQSPLLELGHNMYWLKGENGSGKTTLIKSVAGLIPFEGSISVNGIDIKKQRTNYRLIVNYAEAEPIFPAFLTGTDLIRLYAKTKKASKEQEKQLIEALGIESYVDNKIATYSSGMAKKLSLVLAFLGTPKLTLLDEPLITLDHQSVLNLLELIDTSHSAGITFLVTSHQEITLLHKTTRLIIRDKLLEIG